jgi:NAD+ synthase
MMLADTIAQWIADQVHQAGLTGAVLGLSGGLDSAAVAGLCARGLGPENVLGIIMPAHSQEADVRDAEAVAQAFGIASETVDLSGIYDAYIRLLPEGNDLARANIKPRIRMIVLYYHANALRRMVVGTGNKSELMVGYFTKYGDAGVDLLPIAGLYKHQVYDIAREIGVPQQIIDRPPSAGLWQGQTDEAEMGVTYADLDKTLAAIEAGETPDVSEKTYERVLAMVRGSEHKRQRPPMFDPGQWS